MFVMWNHEVDRQCVKPMPHLTMRFVCLGFIKMEVWMES